MFRLQTQLISNQFLCYLNTHFQRVKTFYQAFYKALKAFPSPANRFLKTLTSLQIDPVENDAPLCIEAQNGFVHNTFILRKRSAYTQTQGERETRRKREN